MRKFLISTLLILWIAATLFCLSPGGFVIGADWPAADTETTTIWGNNIDQLEIRSSL